jgi:hypothetical protein
MERSARRQRSLPLIYPNVIPSLLLSSLVLTLSFARPHLLLIPSHSQLFDPQTARPLT